MAIGKDSLIVMGYVAAHAKGYTWWNGVDVVLHWRIGGDARKTLCSAVAKSERCSSSPKGKKIKSMFSIMLEYLGRKVESNFPMYRFWVFSGFLNSLKTTLEVKGKTHIPKLQRSSTVVFPTLSRAVVRPGWEMRFPALSKVVDANLAYGEDGSSPQPKPTELC